MVGILRKFHEKKFMECEVSADWSVEDQVKHVGSEFRKWCMGLPKGFRAGLARVSHHGDRVVYRYDAMDSEA
jgi:hypothetical protein